MSSNDNNPDLKDIDYRHGVNVGEVHGSVKREKSEPVAGREPVSQWLVFAGAMVLMLGAGYLGSSSGGFKMNQIYAQAEYTPLPRPGMEGAAGPAELPAVEKWMADGEKTYKTFCGACHQASGLGQPAVFPPLAGSEWVFNGTERIAMIVLKGAAGPITVNGQTYNSAMTPWEAILNDKQIAQVMSYIRNEWGNEGSLVTEAMVAHAREKYADKAGPWDEAGLRAVPEDAMLPGDAVDAADPATWENLSK